MMQTPTTRFLCPLGCGWHHDSRDLPDLAGLSGNTIEEIIRAGVERSTQADETAVREHLESHPLIEWATEVARLQRVLNANVATGGMLPEGPGRAWGEGGPDCGTLSAAPGRGLESVQRQVAERFGFPLRTYATTAEPEPMSLRDRLLAKYPATLAELDADPDPNVLPNAEDCPLCTDPNPPYPFICPGHPAEGALAERSRCPHCHMPHDLDGWPAEICRRMRENGRVDDPTGDPR